MRLLGATVAVLACAAMLSGCGSYTKRDFSARADAICAAATRQTRSVPPPSLTGSGASGALAGYLARVVPIAHSEVRQLRALPQPSQTASQRRLLERYLDAVTRTVVDYGALAAAVGSGDGAAVAAAEGALRASPAGALAGAYGLAACAAPGATIRGGARRV